MNKHSFSKTKTSAAVRNMFAASLLAAAVMPAQAAEFKVGDFDLSINSTVSAGTSFRTEGQERALYSPGNRNAEGITGRGASNTGDDGNLNFQKGDTFSTIIKGVHDFELKKDNYGFFSRVKWFYDQTLNQKDVFHGHEPTSNVPNRRLDDTGFHPYARFDGIDVLDAFGYINTQVAGMPADLRLGRQVISWGESLFIQSPISGLNTVDVSALRRPGAELKEAFTPTEMLYMNLGVTDNTSLEAFYQLKWRKTVPEGCGTFFSGSDITSDGCDRLAFFTAVSDRNNFTGVPVGTFTGPPLNRADLAPFEGRGLFVTRGQDIQPDDGGQFGFALRTYSNELDTEFGGYFLNYHSRLPLLSIKKDSQGRSFAAAGPGGQVDTQYIVEYPEDIAIFGGSFSTNVGGWALSGEISHALDVPVQISTVEVLRAGVFGGPSNVANVGSTFSNRLASTPNGGIAAGYDNFDVTQIQTAFVRTFDRALASSQVALVGEVGAVFVKDLPDTRTQRYGRSAVFGGAADAGNTFNGGFVTDFSWGYRLRTQATYRDAFMGIDLIPSIAWSHDVEGWSPEPGQAFNEGRQSVGLGLGFEFDANTKASINYTTFTNAADFDALRDRDFVSFTGSYSF